MNLNNDNYYSRRPLPHTNEYYIHKAYIKYIYKLPAHDEGYDQCYMRREGEISLMKFVFGAEWQRTFTEVQDAHDVVIHLPATKLDTIKSWLPLSLRFGWLKPRYTPIIHSYEKTFHVTIKSNNCPVEVDYNGNTIHMKDC